MGRKRRTRQEEIFLRPPVWMNTANKLKNHGLMLLLFETPSGFALFTFSEVHFHLRNTLKEIWARFTGSRRPCFVVIRNEFQTFDNKSSAINADTGVNKRLADMIFKWRLPGMKLAVGKPEYKTIIESKLEIPCVHNEIVMEVMWGIQRLMHELVPQEKAELAEEDRFPMSQGLKMFLNGYGFDVQPEMLNDQIVETAGALFHCDAVFKNYLEYLVNASVRFKVVSDINSEDWNALKVATALMVVRCPEEEVNFHEVLSEDELLKLREEAPKYKDLVCKVSCMRTYEKISEAHQVRAEKKRLLGFLVNEAKAACEKGMLHGESEQIPQENVPIVLPLPKDLKRSWDSAFEPTVLEAPLSEQNEPIVREEPTVLEAPLSEPIELIEPTLPEQILPIVREEPTVLEAPLSKPIEPIEPTLPEQIEPTVLEKGMLHGESEQIPQEHVPRVLPLPKDLKRSWDSAFEPTVLEAPLSEPIEPIEPTLSLSETGGTQIERRFSFSGAQPSASKAIVPYKPIPHVLQYINLEKSIPAPLTTTEQAEVGTVTTPLASVGDSNVVSGLLHRPPKSVSKPSSPIDGKVLRRSPRLKRDGTCEVVRRSPRLKGTVPKHVQLEDTPRKRHKKIPASSLSLDN